MNRLFLIVNQNFVKLFYYNQNQLKNITKENDVLDDGNVSKPKENPGYLKTLCVLTYIFCGHGLVAALGVIAAGASFAESLADIPGMGAVAGNLEL